MAKQLSGGATGGAKDNAKRETFGVGRALEILDEGKMVAPEDAINPEGKANHWLKKIQAGKRRIVAMFQNGSVGNYGNWNSDIEKNFVEVTEDMIP